MEEGICKGTIAAKVRNALAFYRPLDGNVTVDVTGLIGVYSDPDHLIAFSDGEVRQEFSLCFRARPIEGQLRTSRESKEVRWAEAARLDDLHIHPSIRLRIQHGYEHRIDPFYT